MRAYHILAFSVVFALGCLGTQQPTTTTTLKSGCEGLGVRECADHPGCRLDYWMCDYIPEGMSFDEACPRGGKGVDCVSDTQPQRPVGSDGEFCGGIAGIMCSKGYRCQLDGDYPDAGGVCVPAGVKTEPTTTTQQQLKMECETDSDCAVTGCSGQVCTSGETVSEAATDCSWKPHFECYGNASCSCVDGACGWVQTDEFKRCLLRNGMRLGYVM